VILVNLFLVRGDNPYLRGAAVVVLVVAGVFIFAPFFLLRNHGRSEDARTYMETNAVVDRGLYALVRHPQYLGYMLLAAGFSLLSQHRLAFLSAATGVAGFSIQAVQEEAYCLQRLGEPYQAYLERVPRFNIILGIVRVLRGKEVVRNR
jgi:protein-S-isoprenylcysteine O-methyltransferase Ste14